MNQVVNQFTLGILMTNLLAYEYDEDEDNDVGKAAKR